MRTWRREASVPRILREPRNEIGTIARVGRGESTLRAKRERIGHHRTAERLVEDRPVHRLVCSEASGDLRELRILERWNDAQIRVGRSELESRSEVEHVGLLFSASALSAFA